MNKILNIILSGALSLIAFSGCQTDTPLEGQGTVSLKVTLNNDVKVVSRSAEDQLAENCTLYVYNSESLIRKYHGISDIPSEIVLVSGEYKAVAWAGDSVPASYTAKYYKGTMPFTIEKGSTERVEIQCKIANVVSSVKFDESIDKVLSDYKIEIGHSGASLDFDAENAATAKGYYMMNGDENALTYTITGKQINGSDYTQTGTINDVKGAHEYALTLKYDDTTPDYGGGILTVDVDESTIDVQDNLILKSAPKIVGSGYDVNQPIYGEAGSFNKNTIYITSSSALTDLEMSCDYFTTLGLESNSFNFMTMTSEFKQTLAAAGITNVYTYNAESDDAISKLVLSAALLDKMPNGSYTIKLTATDKEGKKTTKNIVYEVSDASVMTLPIVQSEVNAYSATVRANIAKAETLGAGFEYRQSGTSQWNKVVGTISGSSYYAKLSQLTAGKTYQYRAVSDDYTSPKIYEFTTGLATPLVNGGFENWFTDSDGAIVPSSSSESLFWDCGNHGSITLKINITTQDKSFKHSGESSIKMSSQYPSFLGVGKFAAGNVFVGKYLKTDGTNGVLGFGRSFGARPKALHGYVKYNSGSINYTSNDVPEATKGSNDRGVVYIALLDETTSSYNGANYPFIIKTKTSERNLFNKNAANVIGYGEQLWNSSTSGSDFIEFTIPIDYKSGKIPSNILIVGSASYWGDYFVGSTSSVMWLDDLELIYE